MTNSDIVKQLDPKDCQWYADHTLSYALSALRRGDIPLAIANLKGALSAANRAKNMRQAGKIIHAISMVRRVV